MSSQNSLNENYRDLFITVDPYYDVQTFNEAKEAMYNNSVDFELFIGMKAPYNWFFKTPNAPIMVNYDEATRQELRWMVSTVKPLTPKDDFKYLRRSADVGKQAFVHFTENEPMEEARKSVYAVFFHLANREDGIALSRLYGGKIWFLGKYYNRKFNVCLCTHPAIKNLISRSQILIEKTSQEPGRFEAELNRVVFLEKDYLVKFTDTPYFESGQLHRVKIQGELGAKFAL